MSTPFIGYSNDSLKDAPRVIEGALIDCPHCGAQHALECALDVATQKKTDLLMFYKCGETSYLAAVSGRLVTGRKPDVSGSLDG